MAFPPLLADGEIDASLRSSGHAGERLRSDFAEDNSSA
jgi:hypothetical protein